MVAIIGGGPTGCYIAYLLAKSGVGVSLYEEHPRIGEPIQCTGIITSSINELLKVPDECIVNRISEAEIISPCGNTASVRMRRPDLIIDRASFDRHIAELAVSAGAVVNYNSRFLGFSENGISVRTHGNTSGNFNKNSEKKNGSKIGRVIYDKSTHIVGADGPLSTVAKSTVLRLREGHRGSNFKVQKQTSFGYSGTEMLKGIQAVVRIRHDNRIKFFPHIGTFAWLVPDSDKTARIGLLGRSDTVGDFMRLTRMLGIKESDIISRQGGVVPIYEPKTKTFADLGRYKAYLVGDSAGHVKATTGGGIVPGIKAAKVLANSIINGSDYEKGWRKAIGKDLWMHRKARDIMDDFNNAEWDDFIGIFQKEKNRDILGEISRDNFIRLMLKLGASEPRLWKYGFKAFKK